MKVLGLERWLRSTGCYSEDLGLIPNIHMAVYLLKPTITPVSVINDLFGLPQVLHT